MAAASRRSAPVDEPLSRSKLSRALFEQRSRVLAALAQSTDLSDAAARIRTALNQNKATESTENTELDNCPASALSASPRLNTNP